MRHFLEDDLEVMRSGRPKVVPEEPITDSRGRVRYLQTTKIPFTFSGTGRPGRPRGVDRHHGPQGHGGGPAARGEGGEPDRARGRGGPRLQQPARRDPRPRLARPQAASRGEPRAAARREGGGRGGAGRRPHPADAGLLGPRALRGPAHRRERARAREPAALRGRGAEERPARGAARPGAAPRGRRRGPDPAGAHEPRHQRGGGHRGAGRDGDRGHRRPRGDRRRPVAVARERAAPRPGPLRVARGPRRRAGDGRGDRRPDLRALLHDQVHRARPRPRRRARRRPGPPGRAERGELSGPRNRLPDPLRPERAAGLRRGPVGRRRRHARPRSSSSTTRRRSGR